MKWQKQKQHITKCISELLVVVGSAQRVQTDQSGEVDVVFDDHDVTRLEAISQ